MAEKDLIALMETQAGELQTLSFELNNARRYGSYKSKAITDYGVIAGKDLALGLMYAHSAMFNIAMMMSFRYAHANNLGNDLRNNPQCQSYRNGLRSKLIQHTQALFTLFYGDVPPKPRQSDNQFYHSTDMSDGTTCNPVSDYTMRPMPVTGATAAQATAYLIRLSLPLLTKVYLQHKGSLEHLVLKPLIDFLTQSAWTLTVVNRYMEPMDESKLNMNEVNNWLAHVPNFTRVAFNNLQRQRDPSPTLNKQLHDTLTRMLPDLTKIKITADSPLPEHNAGDFINIAGSLYIARLDCCGGSDMSVLDMSRLTKVGVV